MTQEMSTKLQHVLGEAYEYTSNWKGDKLEDLSQVSCGDFERRPKGTIYLPNYFSGSDYAGSSVEASNFRVWKEMYKDQQGVSWWELYGGWGTYGIAVDFSKATDDMKETLEKLDNYPLIDEEDMSELEMDREGEAWDDYIRGDFASALKKKLCQGEDEQANEELESKIDELSNEHLYELFREAMERTNTYYEHETGGSVYVDMKRVIEGVKSIELPDPNQTPLEF